MFLKCYKTPLIVPSITRPKFVFVWILRNFRKSVQVLPRFHFVVIFDGTLDSGPVVTFCYSNI